MLPAAGVIVAGQIGAFGLAGDEGPGPEIILPFADQAIGRRLVLLQGPVVVPEFAIKIAGAFVFVAGIVLLDTSPMLAALHEREVRQAG